MRTLATVLSFALLAACSKALPKAPDPYASLAQDGPPAYSEHFWANEQAADSPLWRRALDYCQPNNTQACLPVRHLKSLQEMANAAAHPTTEPLAFEATP